MSDSAGSEIRLRPLASSFEADINVAVLTIFHQRYYALRVLGSVNHQFLESCTGAAVVGGDVITRLAITIVDLDGWPLVRNPRRQRINSMPLVATLVGEFQRAAPRARQAWLLLGQSARRSLSRRKRLAELACDDIEVNRVYSTVVIEITVAEGL